MNIRTSKPGAFQISLGEPVVCPSCGATAHRIDGDDDIIDLVFEPARVDLGCEPAEYVMTVTCGVCSCVFTISESCHAVNNHMPY